MHKIIKRLSLFAFLLLICGFAILTILGWVYGDDAKNIIAQKINNALNAEIIINDAELSMISHFPNAAVELYNVSVIDKMHEWDNDTVLFAETVSLMFPYSALWSNNYKIDRLQINDAIVNYLRNQSGINNFIRFDNNKEGKENSFDLSDVRLSKVRFRYSDKPHNQDYEFLVKSAKCKGNWNSASFVLKTDAILYSEKLIAKDVDYLPKKNAQVKASLLIDRENNNYSVQEAELNIENVDFVVNGGWKEINDETNLDFYIISQKSKFEDLKNLLPENLYAYFEDYNLDGKLQLDAKVTGNSTDPVMSITASTNAAVLTTNRSTDEIEHLSFNSTYTSNTGKGKSRLEVKEFNGILSDQPIKGTLVIDDLTDPKIDLYADATVRLEHIYQFFPIDTLETMSGELVLDSRITGKSDELKSFRSKGKIEMRDATFKVKGKDLDLNNISGVLKITGNDVLIKDLNGTTGNTDFLLNGSITNMYPFFFENDPYLYIDADLQSKNIDLDQLLLKAEQVNKSDTVYRLEFPSDVALDLRASVDNLKFRKFKGKNISGSVTLQNEVLHTSALNFHAMSGRVYLQGKIDASAEEEVQMDYEAKLTGIDINEMFYEMGDFGQDIISSENLKGNVTANIQLQSSWTKELDCHKDKLVAFSSYRIDEGELINFEPIQPLHKYVKGAKLDHIYFDQIENELSIVDKMIHFPELEIKSSALDIIASGTHDFDNNVNYKVQLLLSQLLGAKVKQENTEFGEIEDDGLGRSKLFLTMKGQVSDPEIKLDTESIQNKIADEIKKEKQNLKTILSEEFGSDKSEKVSAVRNREEEPEELEIELEPEDDN